MGLSSVEIDEDELLRIKDNLLKSHTRLEALWEQAWDAQKAEHEAVNAALLSAEARKAAPGSRGRHREGAGAVELPAGDRGHCAGGVRPCVGGAAMTGR